jgi:hypothetical protein
MIQYKKQVLTDIIIDSYKTKQLIFMISVSVRNVKPCALNFIIYLFDLLSIFTVFCGFFNFII